MAQWVNPIPLRKAKIGYNFGLSECSRVKIWPADRGSNLTRGGFLCSRKKGSIANSLPLSSSHHPVMPKSLLNRCKIASHLV